MYEILIVEDQKEERGIYETALANYSDVHPTFIEDQANGIDLASQKRFDCMVVDLKIKGGTGMRVVHEARLHEINRATPIYVVSGHIDPLTKKIAASFQVMETIEKPFQYMDFIKTIVKRLHTKKVIYKYDAKLINLLINSGLATFQHYFNQKPHIGRIRLKSNDSPARGQVTSVIDFSSDSGRGSLALSANGQFIKNIAQILLGKPLDSALDASEAADIMGEMANQVIGRIKIALADKGASLTIGLPKVLIEKHPTDYHHTKNPIVFTPFGLDNYGCDLEFAMCDGSISLDNIPAATDNQSQKSGSVILFD